MKTIQLNLKTMKIKSLNSKFMKTTTFLFSALLCLSVMVSCSDDDDSPEQPNEEEIITNVTLTFTNDADPTDVVTLLSIDADGDDGPLAPVQSVTGDFTVGETYTATVNLFNAIEDEDITVEVTDLEPDEHFFVYAVNGLDMTFTRSVNDVVRADGNSLGFRTSWVANVAGTGSITLQLFHESETVSDDNQLGTQTGGSADVDITFLDVEIQ